MSVIVQKFGGTSVADMERIQHVATLIKKEVDKGHQVIAVVSAMAGHTNQLVSWANEACPDNTNIDSSEHDTVLAAGEQITAGLTALSLKNLGLKARSFLGWQMGMLTDTHHANARIKNIQQSVMATHLGEGCVCVCAGFQGINEQARITTLGRGGSDTSAVALAAAFKAERCDIYTDVDGIYSADPRLISAARKLDVLTYEEMLELASAGAKVLHPRSVMLAMKEDVPLRVLSSFEDTETNGTDIVSENQIESIRKEKNMEEMLISGVTVDHSHARVTIVNAPDKPGVALHLFAPVGDANIDVGIISQATAPDGQSTNITFTVNQEDLPKTLQILEEQKSSLEFEDIQSDADMAQVTVVGLGMRGRAGMASVAFKALSEANINIQAIATSEIKLTVLVDKSQAETAAQTLHAAFELDKNN